MLPRLAQLPHVVLQLASQSPLAQPPRTRTAVAQLPHSCSAAPQQRAPPSHVLLQLAQSLPTKHASPPSRPVQRAAARWSATQRATVGDRAGTALRTEQIQHQLHLQLQLQIELELVADPEAEPYPEPQPEPEPEPDERPDQEPLYHDLEPALKSEPGHGQGTARHELEHQHPVHQILQLLRVSSSALPS